MSGNSNSTFGRRKKTTGSKKKVVSKNIPMDVKIQVYFKDPFSRKTKETWVEIPGMEQLKYNIAKQWYSRLILEKAVKIIVIHAVQNCIRACYMGLVPPWFKQSMGTNVSDEAIEKYWRLTKRIIVCFRLFKSNNAGFLFTEQSLLTAKTLNQLKFRDPSDLATECRFREPIYDNVYSLLGLLEDDIGKASGMSVGGVFNENGNQDNVNRMHCSQIIQIAKTMITQLFRGDLSILTIYGTKTSTIGYINEVISTILQVQQARYNASIQSRGNTSQIVDENTLNTFSIGAHTGPSGTSSKGPVPAPPGRTVPVPSGRTVTVPSGRTVPVPSPNNNGQGGGISDELVAQAAEAKTKGKRKFAAAAAAALEKLGLRSEFGSSLVNSIGYVRPYRVSAMESYTGMTPSAYRKHISARGASPTGTSRLNLSQGNNYYGSYNLGDSLNPMARFGLRSASKAVATKKTRKAVATKKTRKAVAAKKTRNAVATKKTRKVVAAKKTRKVVATKKTRKAVAAKKTRKTKGDSSFGSFFF